MAAPGLAAETHSTTAQDPRKQPEVCVSNDGLNELEALVFWSSCLLLLCTVM